MKIPTTISETFDALEVLFLLEIGVEARKCSEEDFVTKLHHSVGRQIRNEWGLWSGESELCKRFNQVGIHHPDDMSSIILTSYHRKVHDFPPELGGQIQHYIEYWKAREVAELLEGSGSIFCKLT